MNSGKNTVNAALTFSALLLGAENDLGWGIHMTQSVVKNIFEATCKVTFVLGNGFDLNLGMKTSYADIYAAYLKKPSPTPVIEAFKEELRNRTVYDKWADFELGMAEYARKLRNEQELIECVRDFKLCMVEHLDNENEQMAHIFLEPENEGRIIFALINAFSGFYSRLTPNDATKIDHIIQNQTPEYNFLVFNYTDTFDLIQTAVQEASMLTKHTFFPTMQSPLHIHGSLTHDVVLGVDNKTQFGALPYSLSPKGMRAFIKPYFNEQFDSERVKQAKEMILNSNIICCYGFSMGETDDSWVGLLSQWLQQSSDHHLVYYEYDPQKYNLCNYDEMIDAEETAKQRLLTRLKLSDDAVLNQLHVPIGYRLFNFELIIPKPKKIVVENKLPQSTNYEV